MPDYKEMYFTMVRETEKAINILINVQKKCEEMAISSEDASITPICKAGNLPLETKRVEKWGK